MVQRRLTQDLLSFSFVCIVCKVSSSCQMLLMFFFCWVLFYVLLIRYSLQTISEVTYCVLNGMQYFTYILLCVSLLSLILMYLHFLFFVL